LANFVPSCRFYGGGSSLELLGQPAQLLSDIPIRTSGGSLAAVSAFGQQELSRGHGVFSFGRFERADNASPRASFQYRSSGSFIGR